MTSANENRWYNTTYVMFASTMLLLFMKKFPTSPQNATLQESLARCIQILEAMDKSVVAKRLGEIVTASLSVSKENEMSAQGSSRSSAPASDVCSELNREVV